MPGRSEELQVVKDALLDEAAKWTRLSDDMKQVKADLDGLELQTTAFFTNNPVTAQMAKSAYDGVWRLMGKLAGEAAEEFFQINEALRRAHDDYEAVDGKSAMDLSKIYGK
ncbi:hypothetical protein Asp14428_21870 [Actinoplanes sp. NBRC 14428]|uniref:Excreted virulence factor EspC (Type VII ESX diderm) n=1 Tax=Pseudosporangium ferrugineum TaxID=439699 RepID=A0A2T0RLM4_9ACTN|nr:hypothetical protein [Pseudosporangium ferrugineum]PRY22013.1 hypothetical protein CLV70_11878 [Pseudosporangium ferrugineum]BCJ50712.1 hypothetical protein Asp14428_21870 [Actinoplanes sp. NBRC 14428]